jgi:single-stranded DNA-binding protein
VNLVLLTGTVTDKPFRPGNGNRTVIKVRVENEHGRPEKLEFDAFGATGDFGVNLWSGDVISVRGRLEDRTYREGGENVNELRLVADHIQLVVQASQRAGTERPARSGASPDTNPDEA